MLNARLIEVTAVLVWLLGVAPVAVAEGGAAARLDLVLSPAPVREQVLVTAARGEATHSNLGVSTNLLDRKRIEEYKEQLSREKLLAVADEAVRELDLASQEQLVLTEVLVLEHVDRLIIRRLNLPTFRKWRHQHVKIRQAQRDPTHWGLDPGGPIGDLAARLDESDAALVLGKGAIPAAHLLAAFEWRVLFIDPTLATVEAAETMAASEGLASRIQALVVHLGHWFPDIAPTLVVLDPKALNDLHPPTRVRVLDTFKQMTSSGGIHCFLRMKSSA